MYGAGKLMGANGNSFSKRLVNLTIYHRKLPIQIRLRKSQPEKSEQSPDVESTSAHSSANTTTAVSELALNPEGLTSADFDIIQATFVDKIHLAVSRRSWLKFFRVIRKTRKVLVQLST